MVGSLLVHSLGGFLVGGGWVAFVTWLSDIRGSNMGGLVAGLPSTAAFGFLFIGWNQSAEAAVQATTDFPLIFSFTGVFLLAFSLLASRGVWRAILLSLAVWLVSAFLIVLSGFQDFGVSLAVCVAISVVVYLIFMKGLQLKESIPTKRKASYLRMVLRFFLGGCIVALAVVASQYAGPKWGTIPAAFPAISTSAVYVLSKSQGVEFSRAFSMPLMMTAMLVVAPYSVAVRGLYPILGIWTGTIGAYLVAIPFAVVAYLRLRPRRQARARRRRAAGVQAEGVVENPQVRLQVEGRGCVLRNQEGLRRVRVGKEVRRHGQGDGDEGLHLQRVHQGHGVGKGQPGVEASHV